ncbi:hypothetical protein GF359_05395 [candidate division WOR-3 bacterium]|uniref:Endonuclease MutS2 n=1 Tax=candidate division WOR-3 bacterium TaxID=2052148 RepID=A0A9D5KAM3_UNCW3|nr:hypothetical protein [candidate division WOR-3 bacterium]MBD3364630.1 hypothetical protein [candidate division WOR-3 bacterium]
MIPEETLERLDFARIRAILAEKCATEGGKRRALALTPSANPEISLGRFAETEEALELDEALPLGLCNGAEGLIAALEAEPYLNPRGFLKLAEVLEGFSLIEKRLGSVKRERAPRLRTFSDSMTSFKDLGARILATVDEDGVKEQASPRLAEIRRLLASERRRLLHSLEGLLHEREGIFQESGIHFREGRLVLAVRKDHESDMEGVVHGVSSGGATVFVEPFDSVAGNNRLRKLRSEEKHEIKRILIALTETVRERLADIRSTQDVVSELDFIFARADWAARFSANPVEVASSRLQILSSRHPLLALQREVVPLDLKLEPQTRVLLISGPNAGGKTVVLKTVGLTALLASCGLHVPALPDTCLPLFSKIFMDIGDEQSIEADLSSFTAHLVNLGAIINQADERSLVLLDELGASTSPEEGGALGMAVLETLAGKGATVIATTHLESLKYFVESRQGMQNAGMEFAGRPTYRLLMGIPGTSNALEIADDVGFPSSVVEKARNYLRPELLESSLLISNLSREHRKAKELREGLENELVEADKAKRSYQGLEAELAARRREFDKEMAAEREKILTRARADIENLVREIKESQASRQSILDAKDFIAREEERAGELESSEQTPVVPEIEVGAKVRVAKLKREGIVVDLREHSGEALVEMGTLRMAVPLSSVTLLEGDEKEGLEMVDAEEVEFNTRLHLRGLYADEALQKLSEHVLEAIALGINEITVVHGKGTGTLRTVVLDFARNDRHVESYRIGEPYEGGDGVTVLRLAS